MSSIHVLKFGGTSLKNAQYINQAADIVINQAQCSQPVVVASAIGGVTDQLVTLAEKPDQAPHIIHGLRKRHHDLYHDLLNGQADASYNRLNKLFDELEALADNNRKQTEHPSAWRDHLLSFGERASVRLLEAVLQHRGILARAWDAQHFIKTDQAFGAARVYTDETRQNIQQTIDFINGIPIITGFIGATKDHQITTLGRSGSDYTASLVADALEAKRLEIWTDVNGVLTADPAIVPDAQSIAELNFDDIAELASHGIGVVHAKTIEPIRQRDISLHVRNSHEPNHTGTRIEKTIPSNGNFRNVTVNGPHVYLEVENKYADSFQRLLRNLGVDVSIKNRAGEYGQFLLKSDIYYSVEGQIHEWSAQRETELFIRQDLYELKKFTNNLRNNDAALARLFSILNARNIRPVAVQRSYRQRYLSLLLSRQEAQVVAGQINRTWIGGDPLFSLFIAGTGAVGGALIKQIEALDHPEIALKIIGHCDSNTVQWAASGETQATNWDNIITRLKTKITAPVIFVDATGSEEVARHYADLFAAGIHIVTPSKLANTQEQAFYDQLQETAVQHHATFRYDTTVGAGLPVISTIRDLQQSGDTITEISGVVSGTMTYLFDRLEKGMPFSEAIVEAREKGYAEPDPRDDLSGEDVARKFLTLAREIGWNIERHELQVQSLIPEELAFVDADTFLNRLPEFDAYWIQKLEQAKKNGTTLRYVGRLSNGKITVEVEEVSQKSPVGQLHGTDNLVRIHTRRYARSPIIIQGPGAGREVTAAGVLTDILKVASFQELK